MTNAALKYRSMISKCGYFINNFNFKLRKHWFRVRKPVISIYVDNIIIPCMPFGRKITNN